MIIKSSRQRRADSADLGKIGHACAHDPLQTAEMPQQRTALGGT
jgi:hypothetical protein